MPIRKLKADILERYPSIHAFCKAHRELARASVYLLFSGKYPGDASRQAAKVRAAFSGEDKQVNQNLPAISSEAMASTLQAVRCGNCRRLNRRECIACRDQTASEAEQLYGRLYGLDAKEDVS